MRIEIEVTRGRMQGNHGQKKTDLRQAEEGQVIEGQTVAAPLYDVGPTDSS